MDALKKFFPYAFKKMDKVGDLVIGILIYFVVSVIAGLVVTLATALVSWIPVVGGLVGWILGLASGLVGLYCLIGIVLKILVYTKVIKD